MSRAPSTSEMKSEPNLTPMLDMVLQLVMFFMLVANFTIEQTRDDVKLPDAQSGRPAEKSETEVLYLNLNAKGEILVSGAPPKTEGEIFGYLNDQYKEAADLARDRNKKDPTQSAEVKTVIIIRGHKDADFGPIYNVLRQAKAAGFRKWQLRVIHRSV